MHVRWFEMSSTQTNLVDEVETSFQVTMSFDIRVSELQFRSCECLAKSSAVYWFHYRSTRIHGWGSLCVKNLRDCARLEDDLLEIKYMRDCARLEDDLLEIKYTNQCINNVRQTCARLLLFNTNVPLFVKKMTLISETTQKTTHHIWHETVSNPYTGPAQCCFTDLAILKAKFSVIFGTVSFPIDDTVNVT